MEIPKEILLSTMEFLTPKDLFNVLLVNKYFHEIANDEYLWQQYCHNYLKSKTKLFKTWKEQLKFYGTRHKFPSMRCSTSRYNAFIQFENGTLYSCGYNEYGHLGLNDTRDRETFNRVPFHKKILQFCAGSYHTLVLSEDYKVYSCGGSFAGQIGPSFTSQRNKLQKITSFQRKKIIQIECGDLHSCALTDDGFVYSWGANTFGQLGHGDKKIRVRPKLINGLNAIKKIYCGGTYSMAINEYNELYVWGRNNKGQLGLGDTIDRLKPTLNLFFWNNKILKLSCGLCHCLALIENGEVYSWGINNYGQLGHGDRQIRNLPTLISCFKGLDVKDVFAFYGQSFVLLENNDIYKFGRNKFGELAMNDYINRRIPEKIKFFQNEKIVNIASGRYHTLFATEDGKIYEIGSNGYEQLGIGSPVKPLVPRLISFTN